MRNIIPYYVLAVFMLLWHQSAAQNTTMLCGIIVDGNNNPMPGAIVKLSNRLTSQQVIANSDGLYSTRMLPKGAYSIFISIGKKQMNAGKISLSPPFTPAKYYNFKISANKVSLNINDNDPFATAYLQKIKQKPADFDFGPKKIIGRVDSSGKFYSPTESERYFFRGFERKEHLHP